MPIMRDLGSRSEIELPKESPKRPTETKRLNVAELSLDQERIEELSVRAREFYEEKMRIRRERRIARLIDMGILLVMAGSIYWFGKGGWDYCRGIMLA
jgi:hypothetical protein